MLRGIVMFAVGVGAATFALEGAAQEKKNDKDKKDAPITVTAGEVKYFVSKSSIGADEKKWTLVLEATSQNGDKKIMIASARAIDSNGKAYEVKSPMGKKAVSLPEGTKLQIELNMGVLPKDVQSLERIELFGDRVVGIPGFETEKKGAFGKKAEERPLVLKNVPVERAKK